MRLSFHIWFSRLGIGGCFVAGLILGGFNHPALASTFTNGDFTTYDQVNWGGIFASDLILAADYNTLFASSGGILQVGNPNGFFVEFSSASALAAYLPDLGPLGPLDAILVDPTTTSSGAFGGNVTALVLDIDYSNAGFLPGNRGIPFGDLVLVNFPKKPIGLPGLNGLTVRQFTAVANTLLGGGGYGSYTIDDLNPILLNMTASFDAGTVSSFATTNLALPTISLVIQTVSRAGNALTFTWNTIPDQRYQVQFSSRLPATNWTAVGAILTATTNTLSATEISTSTQMFYRIQLLP